MFNEHSSEKKKRGSAYKQRFYRNLTYGKGLPSFRVVSMETDLFIHADKNLYAEALDLILKYRGHIEQCIKDFPGFASSMIPYLVNRPVPAIVMDMVNAGSLCHVGPMAAVAGAVAQKVGEGLLAFSGQVIVENGGDLFLKTHQPLVVGIYAGESPLSMKFGISIDSSDGPVSVCTSSGTIGHSFSRGVADAVCVISNSGAVADAAATSVGNLVVAVDRIKDALEFGKSIAGITGIIIIANTKIGAWGDVVLTRLKGKKG